VKIYALKSVVPLIPVAKGETLNDSLLSIRDGTKDMRFIEHLFFPNI